MKNSMIKSIGERVLLPLIYCGILIALTACQPLAFFHYFSTKDDDAGPVLAGSSLSISVLINDTVEDVQSNYTYTKVLDSISEQPRKGTAVVTGSSILYTPSLGQFGKDTFVYQAHADAKHNSDPNLNERLTAALATVTVRIDPVDGTVDAIDDSAETYARNQIEMKVLANDKGTNLFIQSVTQPDPGSSVGISSGGDSLRVNVGEEGLIQFTYTISNGSSSDTANVSLTVHPAFTCTNINSSGCAATFQIGVFKGELVQPGDQEFRNFATPNGPTKVIVIASQPKLGQTIFEVDFDSFDGDMKIITFDPTMDPPIQISNGSGG